MDLNETEELTSFLRQVAVEYPDKKISELLFLAADTINILEEQLDQHRES